MQEAEDEEGGAREPRGSLSSATSASFYNRIKRRSSAILRPRYLTFQLSSSAIVRTVGRLQEWGAGLRPPPPRLPGLRRDAEWGDSGWDRRVALAFNWREWRVVEAGRGRPCSSASAPTSPQRRQGSRRRRRGSCPKISSPSPPTSSSTHLPSTPPSSQSTHSPSSNRNDTGTVGGTFLPGLSLPLPFLLKSRDPMSCGIRTHPHSKRTRATRSFLQECLVGVDYVHDFISTVNFSYEALKGNYCRITDAHRNAIRAVRKIKYFVARRKFQVPLL